MERRPPAIKGAKGDQAKAARIKDALKANIARRKAQAEGRARKETGQADEKGQD